MKGKAPKTGKMNLKAYAGGDSNVAAASRNTAEGFKRGGKAGMKAEGVMSAANAGRKPRKSGGSVMSSASSGTPRGKSSHY